MHQHSDIREQFLDGKRYISGIWRILDSWGNAHSIISGQGSQGWFYGYGVRQPQKNDFKFNFHYLEGIYSEEGADRVIKNTIRDLFDSNNDLYKKEFDIDEPPTLLREHYFEVRSKDPTRIKSIMELATSIPFNTPI
jgi:hypothetical protein